MNMRKGLLLLALVAILGGALWGTWAYFTDSKDLTNTFTVGSLKIKLEEPSWVENSKLNPGVDVKKDPTITVLSGSEPGYVFAILEATDWFVGDGANVPAGVTFNIDTANWKVVNNDDPNKVLYVYAPGGAEAVVDASAADVALPSLFDKLTVTSTLTSAQMGNFDKDNDKVTVIAFAHQANTNADGSANYTTAQTAAEALLA